MGLTCENWEQLNSRLPESPTVMGESIRRNRRLLERLLLYGGMPGGPCRALRDSDLPNIVRSSEDPFSAPRASSPYHFGVGVFRATDIALSFGSQLEVA